MQKFGFALMETVDRLLPPEEAKLIRAIEHRRAQLLESEEEIDVLDYGAGSSPLKRTKEDSRAGVVSRSTVSRICKASKAPFWALLLFKIVREFQPQSLLELGTCVGISAAYQSCALRINGSGNLTTLEGSSSIAQLAVETIRVTEAQEAEVIVGPFHQTFKTCLRNCAPIDYVFIDGHHSGDATLEYFLDTLPYLAHHAILVFDDIRWSQGMRGAWNKIRAHDKVSFSIDLRQIGVCIVSGHQGSAEHFLVPLSA